MRMLLRADFLNGVFGDPTLFVWETNGHNAILLDCGDLSRLATRQLLKVSHLFLSHCHMDHFFGFDQLLRAHMGADKTVTIVGPPETSRRVAGKLASYTWNLIADQTLEFVAIDLHPKEGFRRIIRFRARDAFAPSDSVVEHWNGDRRGNLATCLAPGLTI